MRARDAILRENLAFVYGRSKEGVEIPDPDKVEIVRSTQSIPKGYTTDEAILEFVGEWEVLHPCYLVPVFRKEDNYPYPSFEHALQASKFCHTTDREQICQMDNIIDVKRFVSKYKNDVNKLVPNWQEDCLKIAKSLLRDKFMRQRKLKQTLMKTGHKKIIFQNTYNDLFWGMNITTNKGQNQLGNLLEEIRKEIDFGQDIDFWIRDYLSLFPSELLRIESTVQRFENIVEEECKTFDHKAIVYIGSADFNDIIVSDRSVSQVHAVFVIDQTQQLYCIDLGSTNGTKWQQVTVNDNNNNNYNNNNNIHETILQPFQFLPIPLSHPLPIHPTYESYHHITFQFGHCDFTYQLIIHYNLPELKHQELLQSIVEEEEHLHNNNHHNHHPHQRSIQEDDCTIFIKNIHTNTTEIDLRELFQSCGEIIHVHIPREKPTNQHRGIAFITFHQYPSMLQALTYDGDLLHGNYLKVKRSDNASSNRSHHHTSNNNNNNNNRNNNTTNTTGKLAANNNTHMKSQNHTITSSSSSRKHTPHNNNNNIEESGSSSSSSSSQTKTKATPHTTSSYATAISKDHSSSNNQAITMAVVDPAEELLNFYNNKQWEMEAEVGAGPSVINTSSTLTTNIIHTIPNESKHHQDLPLKPLKEDDDNNNNYDSDDSAGRRRRRRREPDIHHHDLRHNDSRGSKERNRRRSQSRDRDRRYEKKPEKEGRYR
jgi:ribA/ribD-fused uncharacterized protein